MHPAESGGNAVPTAQPGHRRTRWSGHSLDGLHDRHELAATSAVKTARDLHPKVSFLIPHLRPRLHDVEHISVPGGISPKHLDLKTDRVHRALRFRVSPVFLTQRCQPALHWTIVWLPPGALRQHEVR